MVEMGCTLHMFVRVPLPDEQMKDRTLNTTQQFSTRFGE